ncbi:hypothetical protein AAE02nite_35920 [Adhaeribacter aerolatus]|uniref:Tetratricopeptide repeat protein n=1 Tax=Adhaeribacter aerolatus TaxID=670289 RepID=A0A512B1S7_9BACT|nr:hypothetical protein [Adhaeribacter aerolatus]GEO05928.1 hypothetical protein AAE02nite_35920 [Adhaeribacter aerolatus]
MSNARRKIPNKAPRSTGKEQGQETSFPWLKWIGGITALLSLIFAIRQATLLISDYGERQRQIEELYQVGKMQQNAGDYPAAWTSLEQALEKADENNLTSKVFSRLSKDRRRLREAQEDLALLWLQRIRVSQGQTFSDIVDKLIFVLNRGVANVKGTRQADLLAHIGWAYFLKSRDSSAAPDPKPVYQQALQIDPSNPYAHVYWAHWLMWHGGELAEAKPHFRAALAAGRKREYVRNIQIAALLNARSDENEAEFLRVVNDMRKNNEPIDDKIRNQLYSIYYFSCDWEDSRFRKFLAVVPANEQIQLFRLLFYASDFNQGRELSRDACYATLLEAAGRQEDALNVWLTLREKYPNAGTSITNRSEAARKRLSPSR